MPYFASDLAAVLRALRKSRDEAQLTQVVAAVAGRDRAFASDLVRLLLARAPNRGVARSLGEPPDSVRCRSEVQAWDASGKDCGRVDLVFDDEEEGEFCLFVELKLASDYGDTQLDRYRDAIKAKPQPRRALMAVTTLTPQTGEEGVEGHPLWVGSARWSSLVEAMGDLEHSEDLAGAAWRAWLGLLREEGDFGPMNFDPADIKGWARRDQAETFLFSALNELAKPTEALLRKETGASADDERAARLLGRGRHGSASPVVPWKNQPHIQYAVPAHLQEHRCRIQFLAYGGEPYFTVEARYEHPKESLSDDPEVAAATAFLRQHDFLSGTDGEGHYWARLIPHDYWLFEGARALERLSGIVRDVLPLLAASGIFEALNARAPSTPAHIGPSLDDLEVDAPSS